MGKPLSQVPDPFGTHESFAHHNNAMLRDFLDRYGFEYEFVSSTERYGQGAFDDALKNVLRNYQDDHRHHAADAARRACRDLFADPADQPNVGRGVAGADRRSSMPMPGWYPFDDEGQTITHSVLGGGAKLQWKVDWAMRWVALGVDYEMYGKDLTDSGVQSGKIAKALGGRKPEGLIYEMFLDEKGEKISKSKGNGLSLEQWLDYGSEESLAFFAYREPKAAKQLHIGVIPKAVDEYLQMRGNYTAQDARQEARQSGASCPCRARAGCSCRPNCR